MSLSRDQSLTVTGKEDALKMAKCDAMENLQLQAEIILERLPVEKIYHPFVCGPNNVIIKRLMEETGARINVPPPRVPKDEIVVSGEKDDVIWCKGTIMRIYQEKKQKCQTMSVEVKKSKHKYLSGLHGSNLQEILDATGVSVEVPFSDSPSERITLRGEQEKLELALEMVYSKIMTGIQAARIISADVNAPEWLYKYIIGKEGKNIKRITEDIPKVRVEFLRGKDKIQVEGPQNEVKQAVAALQDNVNELESQLDFVEIEIEQQFHKRIIGKAGANIRRIRNETGVMIHIPTDADNSNIIRIEGDRKGVQRAKQQVMVVASRMENKKTKEVIIDQRFHKIFIDAKGNTIQGIRGQFNKVQITFPDQGMMSDIVTLRGPKSDVNKCAVYLDKVAKELETQMDFAEIEIEQPFHKHIIGEASTEIRRIINKTGAMIHVPPDAENSPIICIEGDRTGVQRAKQQLMELASRMENIKTKDVFIDQHLHKSLIGAKGKRIQGIQGRFNQVEITFPEKGKRSDIVMLRGPKIDVDKCAVYLDKIAKKLLISEASKRSKRRRRHILIREVSHKSDSLSYICNVCNKKFSTKSRMKKHKRHHHKEVRPCENFGLEKRFPKETGVRQYERHQKDNKQYVCCDCEMGHSRERKPWKNFYHKDFRRYDCNICDEEHLTKREPWQHLCHQKGFRCNKRDEEYSERRETCQHLHPHKDISTYQCDICGKRFSTKKEMKEHRRHKDIRPYQCNICDDGYSTQRELWQHLRVHKDFKCNECDDFDEEYPEMMEPWQHFHANKDFRPSEIITKRMEAVSYGRHCKKFTLFEIGGFQEILSKNEERKLCKSCQCKFCRKRFFRNSEPEQNKKNHNEFRPHQCNICGNRFSTKSGMEEHMRDHKDVGRIQCDICAKIFLTQKGMKDHKRYHEDVGRYQCDICGKKFSTKTEMEEHRRHHADFRPYQCDVCSERFSTKNEMEQHKRRHKDIKPYQCDICEKKFTTKRGKEQHRQHHYGSMVLSKRQ